MPTAVLDLEIEQLPPSVTVGRRYDHALILLRWRGTPLGSVRVRVDGGRVDLTAIDEALPANERWTLWERWLRDYLKVDERRKSTATATVAVCTRDRPEDLSRCLEALAELPDDGQELLVVDNAPASDASEKVVRAYPDVRYVREPRAGLDVARNRALREAANAVVAFIDDDAVPDAGWLRALLASFDDPLVLAVTGLTMPLELETEAQEWFERLSSFARGFQRRVFDAHNHHPFIAGPIGGGVNMAVRRDIVARVGPFDEALDAGTRTRSGGDHEMFSRVLAAGYRIVYDPGALCWHRHRRSRVELREALYGYGVGVYAAWTRALLVDREVAVLAPALLWLLRGQLPEIVRALAGRPDSPPADLLMAQFRGCVMGPLEYARARRSARAEAA